MSKNTLGAAHRKLAAAQCAFGRAQAAFDSGDFAAAIQAGEASVASLPDHLGAWELLARAHWRLSQYPEALQALERSIALNPYEPGYFYFRGLILQGLGRYGEAIAAMLRCIESEGSPFVEQAHLALAELEAWQEELVAETIRLDPEFRVRYAHDPAAASASRGYRFAEFAAKSRMARLEAAERAMVWARAD